MRDVNRIEPLLERLKNKWKEMPDLRLGQLILAATEGLDSFQIEDDALIEKIEEL